MNVKPGWQTTEFWKGILTQLLSVAVALGVISQQDATQLVPQIANALVAIITIVTITRMAVTYIENRTDLKLERGLDPTPEHEPGA